MSTVAFGARRLVLLVLLMALGGQLEAYSAVTGRFSVQKKLAAGRSTDRSRRTKLSQHNKELISDRMKARRAAAS